MMMNTNPVASTPSTPSPDRSYERARQRVGQIRGFYGNLFSYVVVIGFLAVVNLLTSPSYPWVVFPALGWGIGIAFHAWGTFARRGLFGPEWEERKIRELMERDRAAGESRAR
jgi:2TM domain